MNILLIGSGGREHALAWRLSQSPRCKALYCAPGNAGIAACATCVDIHADDLDALCAFAADKAIDLAVIGPEGPLVCGLADKLRAQGVAVFGPSAAAAQLEGSKRFMKDLCARYNVPSAAYGSFTVLDEALAFIRTRRAPLVVKADGLAAGKGVIIAQTVDEAEQAAQDMLSGGQFGDAGKTVIIEEFLEGEELSFFALTDGQTVLPLTTAQDHKRAYDGDTGPNTGGMGAYSPAHMASPELEAKIMERIINPVLDGMKAEDCAFTGLLYAGIMLVKGEPYVLEFNVRFGDPECQPLMMRLESDLAALLMACAQGELAQEAPHVRWHEGAALCVVMAAQGYPGAYEKRSVIAGIDEADALPGTKVFHAGTACDQQGRLIAAGGRVLGVTATGTDFAAAQQAAYRAVDLIDWPGGFCRRDIGWRAVAAANPAKDKKAAL